jgi:hypothetical protein
MILIMANEEVQPRGSYRHIRDLVASPDFEAIADRLLDGTGARLVSPLINYPNRGSFTEEKQELEIEEYLNRFGHASGVSLDPKWWFPYKTLRNKRPTWDLLCHILVDNVPGLLLVEAKAHVVELSEQDHKSAPLPNSPASVANDKSIRLRICETNRLLSGVCRAEFNLSADSHYQLANRIAYLAKLASHGVPTILVYLGWLKSPDWTEDFLRDHAHWQEVMQNYMAGIVPPEFPNRVFRFANGGSMQMLIRSMNILGSTAT